MTRRDWIKVGAACVGSATLPLGSPGREGRSGTREFSFHYDHILGTSLDIWLVAPDAPTAEHGESVVLEELERLRKVFSLYDPDSELSRLNRIEGPAPASNELRSVLREYEQWQQRSAGACNAQVGAMRQIWAAAERAGVFPDVAILSALASEIQRPGWNLDDVAGSVVRLNRHPLDLNSAAKGFIIGRAAATVRAAIPSVAGGLVNLGGDLVSWGDFDWPIAIQNPFSPEENATPIGGLLLRHASVATSGGYQRFFTIGGTRYSHLLDPRDGQPADGVASATVVARDTMTANILATTVCVLGAKAGLRLVAAVHGADCLIVTAAGQLVASPGFRLLPIVSAVAEPKPEEKKPQTAWPDGFQVTVKVELPKIDGAAKYRRPYVAVWVEDADGTAIRTLSVWGKSPQYVRTLNVWWNIGKQNEDLVKAVTRATRGPGKYNLVWDGKDDQGAPVGQGKYTIYVEVHREFGKLVRQSGHIECKKEGSIAKLEKNDETGETEVEYGKKKQP